MDQRPIPFGFDLDAGGRLIPSDRETAVRDLTEADVARSVIERIAGGSSKVAEARRLNALGIPTHRRYAGGKVVTVGETWLPSRINQMVHNEAYAGVHVLKSCRGSIARAVPSLVARATWVKANAQLTKNRSLAKRNAKHAYALRGLPTCGTCGATYVGSNKSNSSGWSGYYYRCGSQLSSLRPEIGHRCRAKTLPTAAVEDLVWRDCRDFIDNPGERLAEATREVRARAREVAKAGAERARLERLVEAKEAERERVMTLYRLGTTTLDETEAQLGAIATETETLRTMLDTLQAQEDLARAVEEQAEQAADLLEQLRSRADEVERNGATELKRQILGLLVRGIRVDTTGSGKAKAATLAIRYAFSEPRAVDATMGRGGHIRDRGSPTS